MFNVVRSQAVYAIGVNYESQTRRVVRDGTRIVGDANRAIVWQLN
jgi:hypothetical protein